MTNTSETLARGSSSSAAAAPARRRILILDDEIAIQKLLKIVLEGEGYETLFSDDGTKALEMIGEKGVDLVIQDLRMPKLDGLAFLRLFKERFPDVPSIVVTAYGT